MADALHPAATGHLPIFIAAPGSNDVLMNIMAVFVVVAILATGILLLRLQTLPGRMAHKVQKVQFEVVSVLGLLALLTQMHIFWVAGLLLAVIDLPDFGTPLRRIAGSLEKMAGIESPPEEESLPVGHAHEPSAEVPAKDLPKKELKHA